jgi:hypothetical protein
MALALADGAQTRNGRAGWVDANFAAVEHAHPKDITVFHWSCAHNLCEKAQAYTHDRTGLTALKCRHTFRLFFA